MLTDGCGTTDHPGQTHFTKRIKSNSHRLQWPFVLDSCVCVLTFSGLRQCSRYTSSNLAWVCAADRYLSCSPSPPHVRFYPCLSSLDVCRWLGWKNCCATPPSPSPPVLTKKKWSVALKHPKLVKCCDLTQDQQRFIALCDSCSAPSGSLWESGFADSDIINSTKTNIYFLPFCDFFLN